MRIVYVAHINGLATSGVVSKVAGQIGEWRRRGHDVRLLLLTRDREASDVRLSDAVVFRYDGPVHRMQALIRLVGTARRLEPGIVYFRRDIFYPQFFGLPRSAALVLEINEDDLVEYRLGGRRRFEYNRMTRGILLQRAAGVVFVTSELRRSPSFSRYAGRSVVISNGIQLSAYPVAPVPENPRPRLVFVGTPGQIWQGVDKVVDLARLEPEWDFEIVGEDPSTEAAGAGALPTNIRWHGPLDHAAAVRIMGGADIGIGTLALHRKAINEVGALKLREYLALGLPVIYGNEDPDVDGIPDLALRIANTEDNVRSDLARIETFVGAVRGRRVPRSLVQHLDTKAKEAQRLNFLSQMTTQA